MKSLSRNQSGQAVIEYILVLIVVVSILLGAMWQFNDGFNKFTKSYFGDYIACLLELGELPALGGTSSGQCTYEAFTPGTSPTLGAGTGGDDGKDGKDGKGDKSPNTSNNDSASGGSGSGSSGSGAAESSGRFGSNFAGSSRQGRPSVVVIGTAKDDTYTGSTESSNGKSTRLSGPRTANVELIDQSGGVIDPFEERKVKSAPVSIAKDSRADQLKSKKQRVDITRKVAAADLKDKDTKLSFSDFLKWLLIAAIVLAIIVFVGGQALQIGKSWE